MFVCVLLCLVPHVFFLGCFDLFVVCVFVCFVFACFFFLGCMFECLSSSDVFLLFFIFHVHF